MKILFVKLKVWMDKAERCIKLCVDHVFPILQDNCKAICVL